MEYQVIFSRRRTMALQVERDGSVLVRAPLGMSRVTIDSFVSSHTSWIQKQQMKQKIRTESCPEPTPQEAAQLREAAKKLLPERVAFWAARMGVVPTAVHITSARTRFGSCSGRNSISFSWRLMQYPAEAADYVVVHELCHIKHHNHSREFWQEVEKYMPDYRRRQDILKRDANH